MKPIAKSTHLRIVFAGVVIALAIASLSATQVIAQVSFTSTPAPTPTPTLSVSQQLEIIESRVSELEEAMENPPKDLWDKLDAVSGLVSGGIIAAIGVFATFVYRERQLAAEAAHNERELSVLEVQTVQSLMPQLQSGDERAVEAALLAITALGNPKLATSLADLFRSKGSISALSRIAVSSDHEGAIRAVPSLVLALYDEDERVQENAAAALANLGDSAMGSLTELSMAHNADTRIKAAKALGIAGTPSAVERLKDMASYDISQGVQRAAAEALRKINGS